MSLAILSILVGVGIVLADLHTIALLTPVGIGLVAFGIALYLGASTWVASIVGIVTIVAVYGPFFKVVRSENKKQFTPDEEYVGQKGRVVDVKEDFIKVRVGGEVFYAVSDDELKEGDEVIVEGIDGVKLIVRRA